MKLKSNLNVALSPGHTTIVDIHNIPVPSHISMIVNITAGNTLPVLFHISLIISFILATTIKIGDYEAKVQYYQENVGVHLRKQ
jgi:hypothetical protein